MRHVLLLRGINVGSRNRIAMPALREALSAAGLADVRTHVQSGNVVVSSELSSAELVCLCEEHVQESFGLQVGVLGRTEEELAEVVRRNPLGDVATELKRYQVSFCAEKPAPELIEKLAALTAGGERFAAHGHELYAWHPEGVARSRLWAAIAGPRLGLLATSRNWNTVTTLLAMAQESA